MANTLIISSPDNPTVKRICRLKDSARARRESGLFVLEGLRLCKDAVGWAPVETAVMTQAFIDGHPAEAELLKETAENTVLVSERILKKLSGTETPQGIVCVCKTLCTQSKIDKTGKYIALENLSDPSNLGAVARTAEALGIKGIIVSKNGCDRYNPKALRASMGALIRLPVFETENFTEYLKSLDMPLYACVVDKLALPVTSADFSGGAVALIGNEANGLTQEAQGLAVRVYIPMTGPTESLNAATAAAIAMWEMTR